MAKTSINNTWKKEIVGVNIKPGFEVAYGQMFVI